MNAIITDFKKFAVHDGDGIRTTVFFKGCPLKCRWCHNPESISPKAQLGFYKHKCSLCGECANICPNHKIINGEHLFDRINCTACGKCVKACLNNALVLYGTSVAIDEICKTLLEDKDFYKESCGGITLSGGECLMQADACREILINMKHNNINTAVDTCGMVSRKEIDKVLEYTDTFLYDIKAIDEDVHINCTGVSNNHILENLKYIDSCNKRTEIRIPYVPDYNNNQVVEIAQFLTDLKNVSGVRILKYHDLARSKYSAIGMKDMMPNKKPNERDIERAINAIEKHGIRCCK